jgi:hypothetical protein
MGHHWELSEVEIGLVVRTTQLHDLVAETA